VNVSAYRIVQEALTNMLKHAGPARAEVTVGCADGAVTIEVTDDGPDRRAAMISVLIADDQDLIRKGLRMLLEAEPDLRVAGEADDGRHWHRHAAWTPTSS
jgi:signal transduction histidine kinase